MTMMALTRKRGRKLHLGLLALGLLLVALLAGVSGQLRSAQALAEGDIAYVVTQDPAAGTLVQVGTAVTFEVTATSTVSASPLFDFDYPAGLQFVSGQSTPPAVVCANNVPAAGWVRCDYGTDNTLGVLVPVTLEFVITSDATTTDGDFRMLASAIDGTPDLIDGDDSFVGGGTLSVFSLSPNSGAMPAAVFEGGTTIYTATIENTSGVATGEFDASLTFTNAVASDVTCSHGTPGGSAATATCSDVDLPDTETLSIGATLIAANTATGSDIAVTVGAPSVGVNTAGTAIAVAELGLDYTGSTLTQGVEVNVCTALVLAEAANDAAAGDAQPANATLRGTTSLSTLLSTADFQVSGPGVGTVSAATGCGANQSGVRFTPSASGDYSVTAHYNTGGTNVLALTVGGVSNNPVPVATSLNPTSVAAGGGQFTLTVTGSNFVNGATVNWNGSPLVTTFGGATSLTATVPGGNVASAGAANITVTNPAPGGGTSSPALVFTIDVQPNPIPSASSISPDNALAGAAQFVLSVSGSNFVAGSVVRWNSTDLATTFVSANALTAIVPASLVSNAGSANIHVFNPAPGGGISVTPRLFTINPGASKLAFVTQPGAGVAGSPLAAQPSVAVQTAGNVTVTTDNTTQVTLVLNGAGSLTCTGGLTRTVASGVASFTGCAVTPAGTAYTITANASGLTSATSSTFDVTAAPPTSSTELTVTNPTGIAIPRSRLAFTAATGNLDASAVAFIVRRASDNKYWNASTGAWQDSLVLNAGVEGASNTWSLVVDGDDRRAFVDTEVTVELRATVGTTIYFNATIPTLTIR